MEKRARVSVLVSLGAAFKTLECQSNDNSGNPRDMGIVLTQNDDASLLRLKGDLEISVAAELKAALLEAIAAGKAVRVLTDGVTELDVTAFQLLWAARSQAKHAGIGFTVTGQMGEAVRQSLSAMDLDADAIAA